MDYLTTMEMSKEWGISSRRIAVLCEQNRINGVIKKGKTWLNKLGGTMLSTQGDRVVKMVGSFDAYNHNNYLP